VPIVRLKTKEQQVKELFDMFKLPTVDYTKGYQSKPRPELTGGSATPNEAAGLHAVRELLRWTRVV
jgi:hypothetical protein